MTPAQRALFDEHLPYARNLARRFARSAPAWQDEYQSAALWALFEAVQYSTVKNKVRANKTASFKTLAITRIKQRLNDVTRRAYARIRTPPGRQLALDYQLDRTAIRRPSDPLAQARFAELLELIDDDREREAIRLHFRDSRTMREVGECLSCSRQWAAQLIANAIATLRTKLANQPGQ